MTALMESHFRQPESITARLLSLGLHLALLALTLIPWTPGLPRPKMRESAIMLFTPSKTLVKPLLLPTQQQGGGGGGKRQLTRASRGELPRRADKQLTPPDPEPPKNPDPTLIVESTIVAPQLTLHPLNLLSVGDPNGIVAPPSSGFGDGGGIGNGHGGGVGNGQGPGAIDGSGGGCCEGTFQVGKGVSAPVVIRRIEPEYSEEARKARYQGTVMLQALVRKDGTVDVLNLVRSLGFGLDQNAIDALKQWRFRPAMMNGKPVDVRINIEVSFNLR